MADTSELESKLNEIFVDKAPKMPDGIKNFIVRIAPWGSLLIGVLSLYSGLAFWHWAHANNNVATYVHEICATYSGSGCTVSNARVTFWFWLAFIVIIAEGILYLLAYSGLRDRKKDGWNYLYYAVLVNVAYVILSLFTSYNVVNNFFGGLIGAVVGFYFLFQIRSQYDGVPKVVRSADLKIVELPDDNREEKPVEKPAKKPVRQAQGKPAAKKTKRTPKKTPKSKK